MKMMREELSRKVIEALAEQGDVQPVELEPKLYRVIDPDALNRLFAPTSDGRPRTNGYVVFDFDWCRVRVEADGTVSVERREKVS